MRIYLIGFMAAGKTYMGKIIADRLKMPFYDLDLELERETGQSLNSIFNNSGEAEFRQLESNILSSKLLPGVIATGGGVIERAKNRQVLRENADVIIWLHPDWPIIRSRLISSERPLCLQNKLSELKKLWLIRCPLYRECADIIYSGSSAEELIKLMKKPHQV